MLGRNQPAFDASLEVVLILLFPRPVRRDQDVELQVTDVETPARSPQRLLQVYVPAEETPVRRPHDPGRTPLSRNLEVERVPAIPGRFDQLPFARVPWFRCASNVRLRHQ